MHDNRTSVFSRNCILPHDGDLLDTPYKSPSCSHSAERFQVHRVGGGLAVELTADAMVSVLRTAESPGGSRAHLCV